jgi:hypothetical protein
MIYKSLNPQSLSSYPQFTKATHSPMITKLKRSIPELDQDALLHDPYNALNAIKSLIIDEEIKLQIGDALAQNVDPDQVSRRIVKLKTVLSDLRGKLRL